MTALPGTRLRKIQTGLRGCCKALALSATLLSSERPQQRREGCELAVESTLQPEGWAQEEAWPSPGRDALVTVRRPPRKLRAECPRRLQ